MESDHKLLSIGIGNSKIGRFIEILVVFLPILIAIQIIQPLTEDQLITKMMIIWVANVAMLVLVWISLKLRNQTWQDFGLKFQWPGINTSMITLLRSFLVCILAVAAYVLGTMVMANITGMPQQADMSNYSYLQNNLPLLIVSLLGVYIVSSFGEEVIYRAFLMNRISELGFNGKTGKILVVLISSMIFGLVHFQWGITGIVATFFMGLVMGIAYLKYRKNLWILVWAHVYMDTMLLVPLFYG